MLPPILRGTGWNDPILAVAMPVIGLAQAEPCQQQKPQDRAWPNGGRQDEPDFVIGQTRSRASAGGPTTAAVN